MKQAYSVHSWNRINRHRDLIVVEPLKEFFSEFNEFIKRYKVGKKISRKKWGDKKQAELQSILYSTIDEETLSVSASPAELMKKFEKKIDDAGGKFNRNDFVQVARTEIVALRVLYQLQVAIEMGYTHVIQEGNVKCKICGPFMGKDLRIRELLNNAQKRIPLHPNDKCVYKLSRR